MNPKIEKLGAFYLGRPWDKVTNQTIPQPIMLDSRQLVTHAVCLGMTGSGKTGMGISILEEAAIDGIPAIVIDPKGDMTNLALTFPKLLAEDFEPWIDPETARQKGLDTKTMAAATAESWSRGLSDWEQDGERVSLFRESAEVVIFTPGNSAGAPLSILRTLILRQPMSWPKAIFYSDTLSGTVTSLLTLLEIDADPLKSREHILLTSILDKLWRQGESTDLTGLIKLVQKPPFSSVGVFDLDTFFPVNDRMKLAMALNKPVASPDFASWIQGPPLKIDDLLYSPQGKPRITIISIAHLDDRERMFVVSLLLNRLLTWMRGQNGTSSLRALFYMDELFGFLPPVAQPPSKKPLLTLLKQARAFGLGLVLCTQNPVDIDYKALSNIGIWIIGRLQTEQDKNRLLDGLKENPALGNRQVLADLISSLQKRVFLMHNINDEGPYLFHTRWCLSYLSGPLTREQLRRLYRPNSTVPAPVSIVEPPSTEPAFAAAQIDSLSQPPLLPPGLTPVFLNPSPSLGQVDSIVYQPAVIAYSSIFFSEPKHRISTEQRVMSLLESDEKPLLLNWDSATEINCSESDLRPYPQAQARFNPPPSWMTQPKEYVSMQSSLKDWLFRNRRLNLWRSPSSGLVSQAEESEQEFRLRTRQDVRENRDTQLDTIRQRYTPKLDRLQKQIDQAEMKLNREKDQARSSKLDTAVSMGSTLLSALLGKKLVSQSSIGRASSTIRRAQKVGKESQDVGWAEKQLQQLLDDQADLQLKLEQDIETLKESADSQNEPLESIELLPKKFNISIRLLTLCWLPYAETPKGGLQPAWPRSDENR